MELKAATVAQEYQFAVEQYNTESLSQPEKTMVIHQDFNLVDTSKFTEHRRRLDGEMQTSDLESFFNYVKAREAEDPLQISRSFVDAINPQNQLSVTTVLDFGETGAAGHAKDRAILTLKKDPVFAEFNDIFTDEKFTALKFSEAFEDLIGVAEMEAYAGEAQISISAAVTALRNCKLDSSQTHTAQATQFKQELSDMESVEVQSTSGALPTHIVIKTPMYLGLDVQGVTYKVKFETIINSENKSRMQFSLRPVGLLAAYIKAGKSFTNIVQKNLDQETTTMGTYKAL